MLAMFLKFRGNQLKPCTQKPKAKKCVRFADDAKSWDGKRPEHILLENVVLELIVSRQLTTIHKLIDAKNAKMLLILHELLLGAMERRLKHDFHDTGAALITRGCGGEHQIMLRKLHIPNLQLLIQHVHSCVMLAGTYCESQMNFDIPSASALREVAAC